MRSLIGRGFLCFLVAISSTVVLAETPSRAPRKSKLAGEVLAFVPGVYVHGLGHFYAGDYKGALILGGMELAGIGLFVLGGEGETNAQGAAQLGGVLLIVGSWLWDVAFTPERVERRNVRYGHEPKSLGWEVSELSGDFVFTVRSFVSTLVRSNPPSMELSVPNRTLGVRFGGGLLARTGGRGKYEVHAGLESRYRRSLFGIGLQVDRYENLLPDAPLDIDEGEETEVIVDGVLHSAKLLTRISRTYMTVGYTLFRYQDMLVIPKLGLAVGGNVLNITSLDGVGSLEFRWPMFSVYSTVKSLAPFAFGGPRWTLYTFGTAFHFNFY